MDIRSIVRPSTVRVFIAYPISIREDRSLSRAVVQKATTARSLLLLTRFYFRFTLARE